MKTLKILAYLITLGVAGHTLIASARKSESPKVELVTAPERQPFYIDNRVVFYVTNTYTGKMVRELVLIRHVCGSTQGKYIIIAEEDLISGKITQKFSNDDAAANAMRAATEQTLGYEETLIAKGLCR